MSTPATTITRWRVTGSSSIASEAPVQSRKTVPAASRMPKDAQTAVRGTRKPLTSRRSLRRRISAIMRASVGVALQPLHPLDGGRAARELDEARLEALAVEHVGHRPGGE